jgi:hypothetical protein
MCQYIKFTRIKYKLHVFIKRNVNTIFTKKIKGNLIVPIGSSGVLP